MKAGNLTWESCRAAWQLYDAAAGRDMLWLGIAIGVGAVVLAGLAAYIADRCWRWKFGPPGTERHG